jgi:hypothetical protein
MNWALIAIGVCLFVSYAGQLVVGNFGVFFAVADLISVRPSMISWRQPSQAWLYLL